MRRVFLFSETPRAGHWNYRFLVPESDPVDPETLERYASAARRHNVGRDYLAVRRDAVKQVKTGRTAPELLVLAGVDVDALGERRRRIEEWLRRRLEDLERLVVEEIDWEREGRTMVVGRPELDRWSAELQPLIGLAARQPKPRGRLWACARLLVCVAILAGLVYFGLGVVLRWLGDRHLSKEQARLDRDLRAWGGFLGVESSVEEALTRQEPAFDEAYRELSQVIARDLIVTQAGGDAEESALRLESQLAELYRLHAPTQQCPNSLASLLADDAFRQRVQRLYPEGGGEFDPLGWLRTGSRSAPPALEQLVNEFGPRSAVELRDLLRAAREVAEAGERCSRELRASETFKIVFATATVQSAVAESQKLPSDAIGFFQEYETEPLHAATEAVVEWLNAREILDACGRSEDRPKSLAECVRMVAEAKATRLGEEKLQKLLSEEYVEDSPQRTAIAALLKFVRCCHRLAKDRPDRSPNPNG